MKSYFGAILAVVWSLGIFFHIPLFNGPSEFVWTYQSAFTLYLIIPLLLACAMLAIWYYELKHWLKLQTLTWVLFTLTLLAAHPNGFTEAGEITYSIGSNSFFYTAQALEAPGKFIESFHKILPKMHLHVRTHPPGSTLFYYAINEVAKPLSFLTPLFEPFRADTFSHLPNNQLIGLYLSVILIIILGSLTIPLSYHIAKKLYNKNAAKNAALITSTIPALVAFAPMLDLVYVTLALASFYLFITHKEYLSDIANGIIVGILSFMSFMPLLYTLVLGAFTLPNYKLTAKRAGLAITGFLLFTGLLVAVFDYSPVQTVQAIFEDHNSNYEVNVREAQGRSYGIWLLFNTLEVFVFSILPFIVFLKPNKLTKSWAAPLAILILSGVVRGEVARVWLFFMGFMAISIANTNVSKKQMLILAATNILIIFAIATSMDVLNPAFTLLP